MTQPLLIPAPVVVFVRPQAYGNIGALSRAMSNFGCTDLRLTEQNPLEGRSPDDPYLTMDWALAKRGESILKAASWHKNLTEALHDCHLVIGSSGRDFEFERGYARPLVSPHEALSYVLSWQNQAHLANAQSFKWAFVLGPEDDGLREDEAALCHKLIRIPTADPNPSLNIAMAAGVVLYHWYQLATGQISGRISGQTRPEQKDFESGPFLSAEKKERLHSTEKGRADWATFDQKEQFLNYLMRTVAHTQFLKYPDTESVAARIRRWLQSAPIPVGELLFAFEIVYHLKAWGSGKFESRDFLKSKISEADKP